MLYVDNASDTAANGAATDANTDGASASLLPTGSAIDSDSRVVSNPAVPAEVDGIGGLAMLAAQASVASGDHNNNSSSAAATTSNAADTNNTTTNNTNNNNSTSTAATVVKKYVLKENDTFGAKRTLVHFLLECDQFSTLLSVVFDC